MANRLCSGTRRALAGWLLVAGCSPAPRPIHQEPPPAASGALPPAAPDRTALAPPAAGPHASGSLAPGPTPPDEAPEPWPFDAEPLEFWGGSTGNFACRITYSCFQGSAARPLLVCPELYRSAPLDEAWLREVCASPSSRPGHGALCGPRPGTAGPCCYRSQTCKLPLRHD